MSDAITVYNTITGVYKTGRYQSTGSRWYGKMRDNGQMGFLKKEDFEKAIQFIVDPNQPEKIPEIELPPF